RSARSAGPHAVVPAGLESQRRRRRDPDRGYPADSAEARPVPRFSVAHGPSSGRRGAALSVATVTLGALLLFAVMAFGATETWSLTVLEAGAFGLGLARARRLRGMGPLLVALAALWAAAQ